MLYLAHVFAYEWNSFVGLIFDFKQDGQKLFLNSNFLFF